jgi:lipopolysaccharide biosynthesis regulator YciM
MGSFSTGEAVLAKVRMMGFADQYLPAALYLECQNCRESFEMETFESHCPSCGLIHAVTPCHSHDPNSVSVAGFANSK